MRTRESYVIAGKLGAKAKWSNPRPPGETFEERLWSGVEIKGFEECWPWRRGKHHFGYGLIKVNRKLRIVSRLIYEQVRGPIPDGHHVLHSCDYPPCCNPIHLHAGTQKQNIQEAIARGRMKWKSGPDHPAYGISTPTGFAHPAHKLTPDDVSIIRRLYWEFGLSQYKIAKLFSIGATTAYYTAIGHTYGPVSCNHP